MNSTVEKLEGNRVRITVTHTADEVRDLIAETYVRIAKKLRLPGFRPGKAPRPIIDTHVGRDAVLADALEELVERGYPRALEELKLRPIDRPDMGELDLVEEGKDYTFTTEVEIRPELDVSSIEDLKVSVPPQGTSEEEIDTQIGYLLDRFATLEPVEDRGVQLGDFALITFAGVVDGQTADDLSVDKYLYEFGRGIMPEGFEEGLIGAKAGETRTVEITVPDNAANPAYAGKQGVFNVEIHEIKEKVLPTVDDEFAKGVGFDSVTEMRDDMRRRIDGNKAAGRMRTIERAIRELIEGRLVGEVPPALVQDRKDSMLEEFQESIGKQGYSIDEYLEQTGMNEAELEIDMATEATSRIREEFALEALFRTAGLELTDQDYEDAVAGIASQEKVSPAEMRKRLIDGGAMALVREQMMRRAAMDYLVAHTEIVEEEPADRIAELAKAEAEKLAPAKPKKAKKAAEGDEAAAPKKKAAAKKPAADKADKAEKE